MVAEATALERAWEALATVPDPEIPMVTIVDLGMVERVDVDADERISVELLPTFSGCPALDIIEGQVREALALAGLAVGSVKFNMQIGYTSDRITEKGREALRAWGIAPPGDTKDVMTATDLDFLEHIACPRCGSDNTVMRSPFGPALCRSLHLCLHCKEAFEAFKPIC